MYYVNAYHDVIDDFVTIYNFLEMRFILWYIQ